MKTQIGKAHVELVQGDLTQQELDVLVNAANSSLRGGGGVDGALHRAAGPGLLEDCIRLHPDGCPSGEVRVTPAHDLPARFVAHAVGPVWMGGDAGEAEELASAWRLALLAAEERKAQSIGFPAISCGIYGFPSEEAAGIARRVLEEELPGLRHLRTVKIVLFSEEDLFLWEEAFGS
ncbi:MAG: hypothetical protein CSA62_02275 [Planctomycetota bacterium]|nr:MAG: hypothetical protein CSA62_02275 [Planctomycetota bacterium]